jgi:hypothetical protein
MKRFAFLLFITASFTLAQKDFSIYPLGKPLEFGVTVPPLLNEGGLEASPQASMQYVYPDQGIIYSMKFVEPDPNTDYSMYFPEPVQMIPEENQLEP